MCTCVCVCGGPVRVHVSVHACMYLCVDEFIALIHTKIVLTYRSYDFLQASKPLLKALSENSRIFMFFR